MALDTEGRDRLDLSGSWQIAFDPDGDGLARGWIGGPWPDERSGWTRVPAPWNVTHPDAEGAGFYRKVFSIPAEWTGKAMRLHFGGASYRAEAWLNGSYLGSHEGAYTPFAFDGTSASRPGSENDLVVRVAALSKFRDVDGMILQQSPASKQSWYYTYGGLWGEVYLEALPLLSCRAVRIEPDLHQERVLVEVALDNRHSHVAQGNLHLRVTTPHGAAAGERLMAVSVPPGVAHFAFHIHLSHLLPWSCEAPNLYRLRVEVREAGGETDALATAFGMRDFTVQKGQFFLNGEPIFLRGVLLQPNHPVNLVTPPDRDMMLREVTRVKEAGFNLIRVHIRPAPPGYLDLTDQMGILVYAETSLGWIKDGPRLLDHGRREVQALIERDRNHPSVAIWGLLNENRMANGLMGDALIRWARALDPTRVVLDNSGGTLCVDQDFGWADRTTAVPSRETERQNFHDLHIYVGAPISTRVYDWLRTLGLKDTPVDLVAEGFASKAILDEYYHELRSYRGKVFVSELGCGGMADLDDTVAGYNGQENMLDARELKTFRDSLHQGFRQRRLDRVFGSVNNLCRQAQAQHAAGNSRQIEALLANPRISGYVLTQLNDVAWEFHAGILDIWRKPKPAYEAVQRLNRSHVVILKTAAPVVTCGDRVEVRLTLFDAIPLNGVPVVAVSVRGAKGEEAEVYRQPVPTGAGIKELGTISFQTGQADGHHRVLARLIENGETLAEATETILTLPPVDWTQIPAAIDWLGEAPEVAKNLGAQGETDGSRLLLAARPTSLARMEWVKLLTDVEAGQVAILGPLAPQDEPAIRVLAERGMNLQIHFGIGSWMGCYHWIPASDLFAGLPAGGLAEEAYAEVLPRYVLSELGGEVLAGSLRNTQTRREPPAILWYSDVEVIRLGQGALLFCQYRAFDQADANPLAARLAFNLIHVAQEYLSQE